MTASDEHDAGSLIERDASGRMKRDRSERRPRTWRTGLWWKALLGVLVLGLVTVGVYAFTLNQRLNDIERVDEGQVLPDYDGRPEAVSDGPINVLLLGSDTREKGTSILASSGSRSDAIMIANISGDRQHVSIMSVMRDSYVDIPGYGTDKVNAAFAYGGVPLLVQTLEQLIGQRIDHVVGVDFEGFKGLTEAVGGVTLNNQIPFTSSPPGNTTFEQGEITITDGSKALQYVRERKAFDDGDYQRVRNQQAFLKGLVGRILSKETLSNPVTIQQLVGSLGGYVAMDSGLDNATLATLGAQLSGVRSSDLHMFTLPSTGTGMEGGQSVVYVDEAVLADVQQAFANDTVAQYEPPAS